MNAFNQAFDSQAFADKAVLFELLSLAFQYPGETVAAAISSGEYRGAFNEALRACGLEGRVCDGLAYGEVDAGELLRRLRIEHTRLFLGPVQIVVSPYAGVWYANEIGATPLLYVNKESMSVERFMLQCGMRRPEGTNDPLDHIGTELEFLSYLCLARAGVFAEGSVEYEAAQAIPEDAYERFYSDRFIGWAKKFATSVLGTTDEPLFHAAACVLVELPEIPL